MATVNPGDDGSATSTTHAATINHSAGVITTESLTTAGGAEYTMTVTDNVITATSVIVASVANAASSGNTIAPIYIGEITPSTNGGSATINVVNGSTAALNGKLVISFVVL